MALNPPQLVELPPPCRFGLTIFCWRTRTKLRNSDALGLDPNHLLNVGCGEELYIFGHYYSPCPQSKLTIGTLEQTDGGFIMILQKDHIGCLKVVYEYQWADVLTKLHKW
uniref:Isopenicillin N synthase-like Fe(2+) 2OG dioxygenase domain-containing protein n=1 Tax=Lactuca sativa TaxID=4236 RepID=A0A9R1W6X8_LACSA|nr:hypothetical protein LSAT_V11C300149670 [Lactuca sativa]